MAIHRLTGRPKAEPIPIQMWLRKRIAAAAAVPDAVAGFDCGWS